ncbi:MAG: thiamine pyrophosphate-binding protein [Anaerolineae bacterium]|nr:thiamine pyrophosphate-binding protein [Anaerolineae bacterium]NIN96776.1 thiamine pyrophosphate-binding protein [Anaerolineae bacterium]NIQ79772.1 thiamine pyrophosphate-binding protein [Anaerolineae bacterium]
MSDVMGAELLVKCLIQENVEFIFGIPGDQTCPMLDAIRRLGPETGLQFIMTRHEQAAAHMADSYSRVTGRPGVCTGTVGPGAANLVPGVYPAWADSIPMVILTGQNQTWKSYPERGSMQSLDQVRLFEPITKWNARITNWRRIPELVQRAFRVAASGRPGPVHLDLHVDVMVAMGEEESIDFRVEPPERYRAARRPAAQPELVEQAAQMLVEAERPLLHPGGGVLRSGAWDEVRKLAEYLSAPVTTSIGAAGVIPEDHPLCLIAGGYGALGAQAVADVVLLVGGRMGDLDFWGLPPFWGEPEEQKLIQIDIDPDNVGLNRPVNLALVGDAKAVLSALLEAVKRMMPPIPERPDMAEYRLTEETWLQQFEKDASSDKKPIHPLRLMREVRGFFPREAISVVDGGNTAVWAHYLNRIYVPRSFVTAADSGHLGVGLPYAIGAKLARPEQMVYAICGDGAFTMNVQELETAARLKLPLVIVIANDRQWGMIKGVQMDAYDSRYIGVDFEDVRYDLAAQAFGCHGERVEDPEEITPALERAVASGKPAVLDVLIDQWANLTPPDLANLDAVWMEGCELPW